MNKRPESFLARLRAAAASVAAKTQASPALLAALALSCLVCLAALLFLSPESPLLAGKAYGGLEAGKVADRDVVAEEDVTFIDRAATKAAKAKAASSVVPVFKRDEAAIEASRARFASLKARLLALPVKDAASIAEAIKDDFPALMSADTIRLMSGDRALRRAVEAAERELLIMNARGLVEFPPKAMESFNQDRIEIRRWSDGILATEEIPVREALTRETWTSRLAEADRTLRSDPVFPAVEALLRPFVVPSVFFDAEASAERMDAALGKVEPVFSHVARGERVVKKGYLVDESQLQKLEALGVGKASLDSGRILGSLCFLILLFGFGAVLVGPKLTGRQAAQSESFLLAGLGCGYFVMALAVSRIPGSYEAVPWAVFLPTGVLSIMVTVLSGPRTGVIYSFLMSLSLLAGTGMDSSNALFALFSGVAAALSARRASQRIDLVKAGIILAAFQAALVVALALMAGRSEGLLRAVFIAALNGFLCGSLALGLLPLLESALNVATRFRLMELSDLNSPALSRLLSTAPGTYSHSIMVAHMAETACRDIGANALLARVASYYHDIGKADQPEYFTENQTAGNKHDALKPRLSAAVIRAHVKVGVEKAVALGLPNEVVDIIREHHGNSLIRYFYNEALKEEPGANPEEFSYPGTPPTSRESAVVMLADSIEAASRSLRETSPEGVASFVEGMVMDKLNGGMLSRSELSIRDLEILKGSFTRILSGHFHSRIAYPGAPRTQGQTEGSSEAQARDTTDAGEARAPRSDASAKPPTTRTGAAASGASGRRPSSGQRGRAGKK